MADKDNNNSVYHSDNPCKKKLKVILKLPKGFSDSAHPRLQQPPLPSYPHASASPSGKPNCLRSEPTAAADAVLQRPSALGVVPEASRRGASASVQAVKRKLDAFGEGLGVDELVESSPHDNRIEAAAAAAADFEALPSEKGKITPTICFKKPAQKKVEDIGINLEVNHAIGGSPEVLNKIPLPSRKVLEALLDKLQKKDTYQVFAEPVDASLIPDYYDIIKDPMDFATIRRKLREGKYLNLELFKKDVFQISINAMHYNGPKTIYYKQARAILDSARKALSSLTGSNCYVEAVQKASKFKVVGSKKSWKQSASIGNRVELVRSDHITGVTLATGDRQRYGFGPQKGVGSYKSLALANSATNLDGSGSAAHDHIRKKDVDGSFVDFKTSPALDGTGKSVEWKDGRRPPPMERYRRSSYKPWNSLTRAQESFPLGVAGERCQLVPLGYQQDHAYARSLAQFGANLRAPAWKFVARKLQILGPNLPFGQGWIGQQQGVLSQHNSPLELSQHNSPLEPVQKERISAPVSLLKNLSESVSLKKNIREEPKSVVFNQTAVESCQPLSLAGSSALNSAVPPLSTVDHPVPLSSFVTTTNEQLNKPFVDVRSMPKWGPVMHIATQSGQQVAQEHLNVRRLVKPNLEESSKGYSDAKFSRSIEMGLLGKGLREYNSKDVLSRAEMPSSVHAVVKGTSIGGNLLEKESAMTSQAVTSRSGQQVAQEHLNAQRLVKPNLEESSFYNSSKGYSDAKFSRSTEMGLFGKGLREYNSKDALSRVEMSTSVRAVVKGTSIGGNLSEKESAMTSQAVPSQDSHQYDSNMSLQCRSTGKENAISKSMHLLRQESVTTNVPATSPCIVTAPKSSAQNWGQPQTVSVSYVSEPNSDALLEGSAKPLFQDLNSQIELKPSQFEIKSKLHHTSQPLSSHCQAIPALAPVTLPRESENTGYQVVKSGHCHPHLQAKYSNLQFSSHTFLPFSSETALQQTSSSARSLPPDLNVCLQSPTTPSSSRISADSQQPDLALQL